MATKKVQKPFNLLYKFDPQKTGIDKLYDFVTMEGRYIVVFVMFIIISAFAYRFPLDKQLNDQINRSKTNLRTIEYYSGDAEQNFRKTIDRVEATKRFMDIYPAGLSVKNNTAGQIQYADLLKRIREINTEFGRDIVLVDYTYLADPTRETTLKISGYSSTFNKAETFREKLRQERQYVTDVIINNLGSTKNGNPKFNLEIKIKNAVI